MSESTHASDRARDLELAVNQTESAGSAEVENGGSLEWNRASVRVVRVNTTQSGTWLPTRDAGRLRHQASLVSVLWPSLAGAGTVSALLWLWGTQSAMIVGIGVGIASTLTGLFLGWSARGNRQEHHDGLRRG